MSRRGAATQDHGRWGQAPALREGKVPSEPRCVVIRNPPSHRGDKHRGCGLDVSRRSVVDHRAARSQAHGHAPLGLDRSQTARLDPVSHPTGKCPERATEISRGSSEATPPVTRPPTRTGTLRGCVKTLWARSTWADLGGRGEPGRRVVREPGLVDRTGPQTAWEDGGSAVLQVGVLCGSADMPRFAEP